VRKISLIIQREYLTRVRQKSFIVMTIIGPLLMAALFVVPVWPALQQSEDVTVLVVDDSFLFTERLENTAPFPHFTRSTTQPSPFSSPIRPSQTDQRPSALLSSSK